jgi:site-specific DNA-cytosine methylase
MKVLSLFDGISCARIALEKLNIPDITYFASEIDPYAEAISKDHWWDIVRLGDVRKVDKRVLPNDIDLLIGGSPCQDLSIANAKNRKHLKGDRSGLFFEYLRILREVKPKYFVLENVASMSDESRNIITKELGVEPIMIDANLVSAQNRKRYFWTNIPGVELPNDRGVTIKDVVRDMPRTEFKPRASLIKTQNGVRWDTSGKGYFSQQDRAYNKFGKFPTIPTARTITKMKFFDPLSNTIRQLTYEDIEEMQGLPRGYTKLEKENKEKKGGVIGNGFHVDVVAHILSFMKL